MILKMVMKTQIYLWAASLCLLLTLCGSGVKKKGDLEVIPLEAALEKQKGLKVSDCFKKVRYVPLETTNNCLVGRGALAQILGDYIVVISEMNLCHLFDKQTGRFIRSVGRVGQGPGECQSLRGGWQNPHNKLFYFPGLEKRLACLPGGWSLEPYVAALDPTGRVSDFCGIRLFGCGSQRQLLFGDRQTACPFDRFQGR